MPNFFISDRFELGKQKIKSEVILRNRLCEKVSFKRTNLVKLPIISTNYRPFIRTYAKGVHFSFFYDKLRSRVPKYGIKTASVHNLKQILMAGKIKADFCIISPIFRTDSHPNGKNLGIIKLFRLINAVKNTNFILLGGMNEMKLKSLKNLDFKNQIMGFAGISSFLSKFSKQR